MGIFVQDTLELFSGGFSAFFGGGITGRIRLRRHPGGTNRGLQGPDRLRQVKACLLILRAQVIPSPYDGGHDHRYGEDGDG